MSHTPGKRPTPKRARPAVKPNKPAPRRTTQTPKGGRKPPTGGNNACSVVAFSITLAWLARLVG